MDLGLLYKALEQRQVDMVAGNATDGRLSVLDVLVLRDDKHYFPPYDCTLAVRAHLLKSRPDARDALAELAGRFSDLAMQKLNYGVDGDHRPVQDVAREFLRSTGLYP
jgi:glycine betaine/choline ABC-type transport system substrate-binding protein